MATLKISVPADFDVESPETQANQITLQPKFYGRGRESAPCVLLQVLASDGRLASRYVLKVDGRDLSLELLDRTAPVMSEVEARVNAGVKAE